jgi:hypothetical protein
MRPQMSPRFLSLAVPIRVTSALLVAVAALGLNGCASGEYATAMKNLATLVVDAPPTGSWTSIYAMNSMPLVYLNSLEFKADGTGFHRWKELSTSGTVRESEDRALQWTRTGPGQFKVNEGAGRREAAREYQVTRTQNGLLNHHWKRQLVKAGTPAERELLQAAMGKHASMSTAMASVQTGLTTFQSVTAARNGTPLPAMSSLPNATMGASASTANRTPAAAGQQLYDEEFRMPSGKWETIRGQTKAYLDSVAESFERITAEGARYRRNQRPH